MLIQTLLFVLPVIFIILFFILRFSSVKGKMGEKRVGSILASLPEEEYKVINNLLISQNGRTTQIDHVVVSEYGIFVVETKNYSGWVYGSGEGEYWTKNVFGNKYKLRNPIHQNRGHISALMNLLPNTQKNMFVSIIAFSPKATLRVGTSERVIYWNHLKSEILSCRNKRLSPEQVKEFYELLLASNIDSKEAQKQHVKNVRKHVAEREQAIAAGKCPHCGGNLVMREGKYGRFYGCSNYPKCKFTCER